MFLCFQTRNLHQSTCSHVFSPISAHFYPPLHHNGKGSIKLKGLPKHLIPVGLLMVKGLLGSFCRLRISLREASTLFAGGGTHPATTILKKISRENPGLSVYLFACVSALINQ